MSFVSASSQKQAQSNGLTNRALTTVAPMPVFTSFPCADNASVTHAPIAKRTMSAPFSRTSALPRDRAPKESSIRTPVA